MAPPRTSLRVFLKTARTALRAAIDSQQKITFVIGNESADLDSMTSSLLYAYIRSQSPPRNAFTPLYIPITNIPSSGLSLRPEYTKLFEYVDIGADQLITLDDLPDLSDIESKLHPQNTKWILVDHNALQGRLGSVYGGRVGGVIDHHDDEGKVPQDTGEEPRIVKVCGSCTTLVTEYCREAWDSLSSTSSSETSQAEQDIAVWDAQVAHLALGSILIDTTNLESKDKTTSHDTDAVEYLEAKLRTSPKYAQSYDRSEFYTAIDTAKKDIGALKLQDILRKDYKQWDANGQSLGVSSVVKAIPFLRQKAQAEASTTEEDAFLAALDTFSTQRNLDLYAVMTTSTSTTGDFKRELLLWAFNDRGVRAAQKFATDSGEELGLVRWGDGEEDGSSKAPEGYDGEGGGWWRRVWWQERVEHSRKKVAPLLRGAMESSESP